MVSLLLSAVGAASRRRRHARIPRSGLGGDAHHFVSVLLTRTYMPPGQGLMPRGWQAEFLQGLPSLRFQESCRVSHSFPAKQLQLGNKKKVSLHSSGRKIPKKIRLARFGSLFRVNNHNGKGGGAGPNLVPTDPLERGGSRALSPNSYPRGPGRRVAGLEHVSAPPLPSRPHFFSESFPLPVYVFRWRQSWKPLHNADTFQPQKTQTEMGERRAPL